MADDIFEGMVTGRQKPKKAAIDYDLFEGSITARPEQTPAAPTAPIVEEAITTRPEQTPTAAPLKGTLIGKTIAGAGKGTLLKGLLRGQRDFVDAGAQMAPRGLSVLSSGFGLAPNRLSDLLDAESRRVDEINTQAERSYEDSIGGKRDFDAPRMLGNILSPPMLKVASKIPAATTLLGRALTGGLSGGISGLLTPVDMSDPNSSFGAKKTGQVALGTVVGGAAGPIMGEVGDRVVNRLRAKMPPPTEQQVEKTARKMTEDAGLNWEELPDTAQTNMKQTVASSAQKAAQKDPLMVARQADFDAEQMQPLLSHVTRDPRQYANERNLRQDDDAILTRMSDLGKQLTTKVKSLATGAKTGYQAGTDLNSFLASYDDKLRSGVTEAYKTARASAGADAELPLQGLAQDVANIIDSYGESSIPSGVLTQLRKYGILSDQAGQQTPRKLFTVMEVDKLLQIINTSGESTNLSMQTAKDILRQAVKRTVTEPGVEDVFAPARRLAAERFALHDAIPALDNVVDKKVIIGADGKFTSTIDPTVMADQVIDRFVINGKIDELRPLANLLKKESPELYQQVRAQIGERLRAAAYGQNVPGDKSFAVERYADALNKGIGPDKMSLFFNAKEIARAQRLGRIGGYIYSHPDSAPVQTSNNLAAINRVTSAIAGNTPVAGMITRTIKDVATKKAIDDALRAEIPKMKQPIDPATLSTLNTLINSATMGGTREISRAIQYERDK